MLNMIRIEYAVGLMLAVSGIANADLINGDFELPLAPDWVTGGSVGIEAANNPAGMTSRHAVLADTGTTLAAVSGALHLSADGQPQLEALMLAPVIDLDPSSVQARGSFLTQSFTEPLPMQVLSFQFNFLTNVAPGDVEQSFAVWSFDGLTIPDAVKFPGSDSNLAVNNVSSPGDGTLLASSRQTLLNGAGTGFLFQSGVQTVTFMIPLGTENNGIVLAFGNLTTSEIDGPSSRLLVDIITIGASPVIIGVPEPSSFALLGIAASCGLIYRKRFA